MRKKSIILLIRRKRFAIIIVDEEDNGHSAHYWSPYQGVGSLPRIGESRKQRNHFLKGEMLLTCLLGASFLNYE